MRKKYYIGLDIGTESVGWAVTDSEYNLIKVRGKDYWGSYLFDEAKTAAERRGYRTSRRRLARVHHRIMLLQELFAEEIAKIDPTFFIRLNNSQFLLEDKDKVVSTKNILFADAAFKDKDYHKKYPTIFHLRNELITSAPNDVRKLYLAIHHIIKNRGHFLFEGRDFNVGDKSYLDNAFKIINQTLTELDENYSEINCADEIFDLLIDKKLRPSDKQKQIAALLGDSKNKQRVAISKALAGTTFVIKELFNLQEYSGEVEKLSFSDNKYDESLGKLETSIDEGCITVINALKSVYDLALLDGILHGCEYISQAKVEIYETHKNDLKQLKAYIRQNCPEKYELAFRRPKNKGEQINNYAAYIGMDKQKSYKHCSKQDFYDFLRKTGDKCIGVTDQAILEKIEKGIFMPKQISGENGVIPYQAHLNELEAILKTAEAKYPFLKQKTDGLTVSEKIIKLMTFRVPYYVGPFTTKQTKCSWMVKRDGQEATSITPWNFDSVVDKDKSEERFIQRMTNKCSYLVGEDVLPQSSLLYSEYMFLNELNNLKVNGEKIPEVKRIILDYAKSHKKVTLKKCFEQLVKAGLVDKNEKYENLFSGTDGDFTSSLSSYIDFKAIVGDLVDTNAQMCEEIILWITVISDKDRLQKLIKGKYGKILNDEQIKKLKGLNYNKWGRLSKKLLTEVYSPACSEDVDQDGVLLSIIDKMRVGNENFMQLLSMSHGYRKAIDEINNESSVDEKITYKTVDELYCSPSVKRAIWRTVSIVKEIRKAMKEEPTKVFIEMARGEGETKKGNRTVTRKQRLIDLYAKIKEEGRAWKEQIEKEEDTKFNSDKLYLYYTQMGRDIYTGEPIDKNKLFNENLYDIDHIYPQSKIKDDSLNNRVLASKKFNQFTKGDRYPLPAETQTKMRAHWEKLLKYGLITRTKFERLVRNYPLTEDECADFINRQLVETRQSTKAVAEILKKLLPEAEIVYAKAANAAEFKDRIKLVKVRELNDLHHAKDAYINVVIGNVYNTKYGHNAAVYFKTHNFEQYNPTKLLNYDVKDAWKAGDENRIYSIASKNTCRVVRFTSMGTGKMFDATLQVAQDNNDTLIPLKETGPLNDTAKYGGYTGASTAYFMLVKSVGKKGKTLLTLETVSILTDKKLKTKEQKTEYCKTVLGLNEPEILIEVIKINTLFNIDGSYAYIRGTTGDRIILCNATQLLLEDSQLRYLKKIANCFRDKKKYFRRDLPINEHINAEDNLKLYDVFTQKLSSKIYAGLSISGQAKTLITGREKFINLTLENQCIVLFEILKFMQCKSGTANVEMIDGSKNSGKILTAKAIQDKDVKMILQSPTGLYHKVIDFKSFL